MTKPANSRMSETLLAHFNLKILKRAEQSKLTIAQLSRIKVAPIGA